MKTRILLLFTQKAQSSAYQYGAEVATRICGKSGSLASLRDNSLFRAKLARELAPTSPQGPQGISRTHIDMH